MNKDKFRITLMTIVVGLLLATSLLYGVGIIAKDDINLGNSIAFIIPIIAVLFMVFFIRSRFRDVKAGIPLEDERSRKVMTQTAATTFYVSFYWMLFISFFESTFAKMFGMEYLDAGQTVGGAIAGMTIFFIIFWFYYNKKGTAI